jgi:type I restriction enzyme S subunit
MKLAAYPEYKDSGQAFVGKIPAHWEVFRNGRLFSQRNETGFGELPILEVSLKTGVRVRDMDNLKRKQVMSDREKYKRAAQGDVAYNMMRMWQGAVGVAPIDGLVSPAYVVVRPHKNVDSRYFTYLFRTVSYMKEVDAYSRGIVKDRNRLYWQDFKRLPSVVPPVEEQQNIARFLNSIGLKAQRFIRNKRRLIELLKEQKQNIINQAVTRGLDPNTKLKPSGVEWIGDIPKHWEVWRLKFLAQIRNGQDFKEVEAESGYPVIGSGGQFASASKFLYEGESVLFGRKGTVDKPLYINGRFWTVDTMFYTEVSKNVSAKFLYYSALTFPFDYYSTKTALPSFLP